MGKRIMVVDDESDVCFTLGKVLGENGYVVDSYEDPFLALSKFKADLYHLVILDIKMHVGWWQGMNKRDILNRDPQLT